jgi:two-component system, sensor histidine kinase and response regulator
MIQFNAIIGNSNRLPIDVNNHQGIPIKRFILSAIIILFSISAYAQSNIEKTATRLANTSGAFLHYSDYQPLKNVLSPLILNDKSVKAVVVTENAGKSIVFRSHFQGKTLVYDQPIPQTILIFKQLKENIVYKNKNIGSITIYYVDSADLLLTVEERSWIKNNPVIKLAPDPGFAPVEFLDEQGVYKGIVADYLKIIAKKTNLRFEAIPTKNWGEAVQLIKSKKAHMMGMNLMTAETLVFLNFTQEFIDFPTVIIGRAGTTSKNSIDDFNEAVIHVVKGYPTEQLLRNKYPNLRIATVSSLAEGLRKVSFGEIVYLSGYLPTISYQKEKQSIGNIKIVLTVKDKLGESGMATRKDLPILRNILAKGLDAITQEEKRTIINQWLSFKQEAEFDLQLTPEERDWLKQHKSITVGGPKAFPPFNYFDEKGEFFGMAADYMKLISERTGLQLEIQSNLPWPEVLKRSKEKKIDVISCTARSQEREKFLLFSKPYLSSPLVIFVQQNAPFIGGLQDLVGKKVAIIKRGTTYDWLQRDNIKIVPHFVKTPLHALKALSVGTVDAYIGNLAASSHIIETAGLSNIKIAAPTQYDDYQLFMGVRKDWPELVSIINKVLDSLTPEEKLRISRQWVSIKKDNLVDYSLVWKIAAAMGAIIILIIGWAVLVQRQKNVLQVSEERFRGYFENSQIGMAVSSPEKGWLEANQRLQDMLGYSLQEMKNMSWVEMTHPEDVEADTTQFKKMMKGEFDYYNLEKRFIRKDGGIVHTNLSASCIRNDKAQIDIIIASILDITERIRMENDIIEAKNKAEEATQAKGDFLANMSHEIRTPMNAIMGMTHLALQTQLTKKQQDYLNKVHSSATSLLGLINDILDFSKIEAGKLDMEKVDFSLDGVLDNVSTLISAKAHEKELEFLFHISSKVPKFLIGDPLRLGQILINLSNNAVKFTEVGEVVINIELKEKTADKSTLQFIVRDTGIGLSEDQMGKLFQSFTQADASTTRKFGGTGLGLTISKELVELMGGEIWVESEVGKGSSFIFTAVFETQVVKKQSNLALAEDLKGLRVLVVDDNATSRQIFEEILESFSFEVHQAYTGGKALDALTSAKTPFDLVIMDWKMPGMDGIETSRQIKNTITLPHIPKIIMCTSYGREELMQQSQAQALDGFLIKPVNPSVLLDTILEVFGKTTSEDASNTVLKPITTSDLDLVRGAKILVVEDNEINQQVAQELLEGQGFFVDIANNGQEGVEQTFAGEYDIVLMDIQMPVMGGYDAAMEIRKNSEFKDLPVLAMTANAMVGDREKALDSGMNDHISKPIDPTQLFAALVKFIKPGDRKIPDSFVANSSENEDSDLDLPDSLPGLEIESGVNRVGGNKKLYVDLLKKFSNNQSTAIESIQKALEDSDQELATRLAHTLKGVAGNIGAMDLHEEARLLETEIKENPSEKINNELLVSTQKALDGVIASIARLEKEDSGDIPASDEPIDPDQVKAMIKELDTLLKDDDTEAAEIVNSLVEMYRGREEQSQFESLARSIDQYDFEKALDQLKSLNDSLKIAL